MVAQSEGNRQSRPDFRDCSRRPKIQIMKREDKIRIVVVDDRPVVLYGLQSWFESHERFRVTACVRSTEQLLARLRTTKYDVIVVSCIGEGPGADHAALLRELRLMCPATPVVAFTDEIAAGALADIQRAGAAGLVSTREEARTFERVCSRVLSGASNIVSPRIAGYFDAGDSRDAVRCFDASSVYRGVRVSVRPFGS